MLTLGLIIWNISGVFFLILTGMCSDYGLPSDGLEFINPIYIYKHLRVNYFGVVCVTLILNALCPVASIGYWFYKLCTVGRK